MQEHIAAGQLWAAWVEAGGVIAGIFASIWIAVGANRRATQAERAAEARAIAAEEAADRRIHQRDASDLETLQFVITDAKGQIGIMSVLGASDIARCLIVLLKYNNILSAARSATVRVCETGRTNFDYERVIAGLDVLSNFVESKEDDYRRKTGESQSLENCKSNVMSVQQYLGEELQNLRNLLDMRDPLRANEGKVFSQRLSWDEAADVRS